MLKINKNRIYLTRGDSANIDLDIHTGDGAVFTPDGGDQILFTVRKTPKGTGDSEMQVEITDGVIRIKPHHTENMKYGPYMYDIQVNYASGDVETILTGEFILTAEVT